MGGRADARRSSRPENAAANTVLHGRGRAHTGARYWRECRHLPVTRCHSAARTARERAGAARDRAARRHDAVEWPAIVDVPRPDPSALGVLPRPSDGLLGRVRVVEHRSATRSKPRCSACEGIARQRRVLLCPRRRPLHRPRADQRRRPAQLCRTDSGSQPQFLAARARWRSCGDRPHAHAQRATCGSGRCDATGFLRRRGWASL